MPPAAASRADQPRRHRPSRLTVFTTAFVAGAAVAFGVNRMLDVHLAQARPQVECEPIFVALHSLPQGSPITVWDVALKDWPRAMLPVSALRARDTFEGMVLRHPLREGQPLLSVQLMPAGEGTSPSAAMPAVQSFTAPLPAAPAPQAAAAPDADLWAPAAAEVASTAAPPASRTDVDIAPPAETQVSPRADAADTFVAPQPAATPPAATAVDVVETDVPSPVAQAEPVVSDPAASEPTLAAMPEPAADHEPELAEPQLVATTPPLYAPVPASPPSSLDAPLSGVGGLTAAGESAPQDSGRSVLAPTTAAAPAASAPQSAGRYLVVPERIALQADASFTPPPAAHATPPVRRPQSASTAKTATSSTNRAAAANRATGPQRTETRRSQPQQPTASAGRQPAVTAPGRQRAAMFPNLAAGLEALGGSQRKPAAADQSPATTR